jgi:hypothetical protein
MASDKKRWKLPVTDVGFGRSINGKRCWCKDALLLQVHRENRSNVVSMVTGGR